MSFKYVGRALVFMLTCPLYLANDRFAAGVHKMVCNFLKKDEEGKVNTEKWLSKEAARLELVQKAGTFR
jgi:hypothetical protein